MKKNKILLVDDELIILEILSEYLTNKDYEVQAAESGQKALEILNDWTPDLILCDIMMPILDGLELHKIISENKLLSTIPFIFLTAKNEKVFKRKCLIDGADDYISKPFKLKELLDIIESKINRFEKIKNAHNNLYVGEKKYFLHEVNTPLHTILGFINLLISKTGTFVDKETPLYYNAIKTSAERLNRTIQNSILYENFKGNNIEFPENSISKINQTFFDVKRKILKIHKIKDSRILFKIKEAELNFDQNHLSFILFELIDNALKFSETNKRVIIYGAPFNDKYYELTISDYGIGFSEEELKNIDAGQQFNREKREQQGLGLGLFLSRMIIKKSKGLFTILSKLDEGSKISIFLPLHLGKNTDMI